MNNPFGTEITEISVVSHANGKGNEMNVFCEYHNVQMSEKSKQGKKGHSLIHITNAG